LEVATEQLVSQRWVSHLLLFF